MGSNRYGILIGCNKYDHLTPLRCSQNDVEEMEKILANSEIGNFTEVHKFIKGESNFDILPKLEELITDKATTNDSILIYFSGHGKLDTLGRLYLAVKGSKVSSLDSTSLAIDRIVSYVDRSSCKSILLILDCCYSGAAKEVFRRKGVDDAFNAATFGRGFYIITSSTNTQESHEIEGKSNSYFTAQLIEGLKTGSADLDNNGSITIDELYKYVSDNLSGFKLQNPMKFNIDVKGDFVVAKNINYSPIDPSKVPDSQFKKFFAVKTMIEMVNSDDPPMFMVMLFRYIIEDEEYRTSGLTVSDTHTPNIRQTQDGFECDAFFPPNMLSEHATMGKEPVNGVMKVRMKVKLDDIMFIIGKTKGGQGRQIDLYSGG